MNSKSLSQSLSQAHENSAPDWWQSFHLPVLADLFLARNDQQELQATLDFLTTQLVLPDGGHVYDQCCGIGSLSIALALRGMRLTGADLCESFIERAIGEAAAAGVRCDFHCVDAFEFVPDSLCDAVFNWYSSFGYADSDTRNRQMFQRAFEALKPSGRFALDVPNLPSLLRGFQRYLVRRGQSAGRLVTLIRESEIDLEQGALRQQWTWLIEGEAPVERRSSLRLYLPHQIREMLEACGFENVRFFGGLQAERLSIDSPRLLCVATKPEKA